MSSMSEVWQQVQLPGRWPWCCFIKIFSGDHYFRDETTLPSNAPRWSVYHYTKSVITHNNSNTTQFEERSTEIAAVLSINDLPNLKPRRLRQPTETCWLWRFNTRKGICLWRGVLALKNNTCVVHPLLSLSLSLVAILAPWCLRVVLSVWQVKFSLLM